MLRAPNDKCARGRPTYWTRRPFPVIITSVKRSLVLCLLVVTVLSGCGEATPDSTAVSGPTSTPPTPTPVLDTPEATVTVFLAAWEARDYSTMYGLLSPSSRAAIDADTLTTRCESTLQAAIVLTATTTLQAVLQEGERAWATYHLTWDTALVGTLVTDTVMSLSFQDGLWGVEWSGDVIWPGLGEANHLVLEHQVPARANIYDRSGLALASEGTIVTLGVVPNQIQDEQAMLSALSLVTGLPPEEVRSRYAGHPAEWWSPIADIPAQVSIDHAALLFNTPGIEAREKEGRTYWGGMVAPHVVGWVSLIPAEDAEIYRRLGYRGDAWVGVAGLERWGESYLAGRHGGTLYMASPNGQVLSVIARQDAIPSRAMYTTIDRAFQRQVQEIIGDRRGAIAVLDVHTGAIRALASGPSFDPNIFVGPGSGLERSAVLANPEHPLLNRATQGTYPCGSVFKIVTIAAALESGGMTSETSFSCPGSWEGLGPAYRKGCWKEDGHGDITLEDALTASCDVTFYSIGQALDQIDPNILPTFGRGFGLGAATDLEGIVEVEGLMPDPAWKLEVQGENWWVGDTVNLAIGQGYLLVNPLQVARMMAAVANGGTLYRPYVVERIASAGEGFPEISYQPETVGSLPVSPQNLEVIRRALVGVTTDSIGTAWHRYEGMSIPVAGKTGTAEAPGAESLPHSWFAAYAPADNPEIAIVVLAENAGEGSTVAAPMVRQVVEAYYGLPLTPLPPEADPDYVPPTPTVESQDLPIAPGQ
jgi:penicillin-binding protein 2